ncbi:hypothetical protein BU24DRAFT_147569 [Aaosphaeria arxii CBS 175.79]|uniref:Uncharacterized protein n=1 Tax=Aaosphaeria arxii CBS 175.79 TaxID=1450172 RepID=A0A6A5XVE0_9PLEO|nr:uncharacterized protein BU24DRAFT_147569 [Aaosphaeria arxii CBS 175.79]KAF2017288.1 hypothetical protein BU24DRAFT_147569 [Aaosphaeria arxii CBS 175.79]
MSTTYMTIHDLLRITHTYEARAYEAQARERSDSMSSMSSEQALTSHMSSSPSSSSVGGLVVATDFSALETDFTKLFARKKRDSVVSIT